MADRVQPIPHDAHDLELIAGLAAGDLAGSDATRAEALLASCADCALLASDLAMLGAALRSVGSAFDRGSVPAPRDFRLTAADAARLNRGGGYGSGLMATSRSWMRGAGIALATFGLVGVLVSAVPLNFLGAGGAATTNVGNDQGFTAAPLGQQRPGPEATSLTIKASGEPERGVAAGAVETPEATPPINLVTAVGAGALAVGVGLILASRRGRRSER